MSNLGSPVALLKLQIAPKFILLISSGSKKKEPRCVCLSEGQDLTIAKNVGRGFFFHSAFPTRPQWVMASSFTRFLDHIQRRTTVGRTPLDGLSASGRDLYLTTHNTHNRQTSMPRVGFEPTISADERPQIYALDRPALGPALLLLMHLI
jgi:hypothetical protein